MKNFGEVIFGIKIIRNCKRRIKTSKIKVT